MTNILKSLIILVVSILCFNFASAQHDNSFIGIRFGYALPMGQLASHEFSNGGYALLGKSYGAEAAWFVNPKLGFGVDVSSSSFGFASGYYAVDLRENTPEYISAVDLLSGPYKVMTYMGGVYYKVEFSPRLHSSFKLMGGVMSARTPDQFYGCEIYVKGKSYWWKTSSRDTRVGFQTGASLEYKIYDKMSLLLQADFTYAELAFPFFKGTTPYTDYMKMPVLRVQPGINICF